MSETEKTVRAEGNRVMNKLRGIMLRVAEAGGHHDTTKRIRGLLAGAMRATRSTSGLGGAIAGIATTAEAHAAETESWATPEEFAERGGRFDACDLRHWNVMAERAGVPFIEARPVLTLTQEEISLLSGTLDLGDSPVLARVRAAAAELTRDLPPTNDVKPADGNMDAAREAALEKCFAAMDDVPEGWMVRHTRCGPSTLKALASVGLNGPEASETVFGPELTVGPGWIREGNRRRVHVTDDRVMKVGIAPAGETDQVWVARPWVAPGRWTVHEDPHRVGSPFSGKGAWPAEWRAFVENGTVTGVAYYYAWAGEATALDAWVALRVREAAQAVSDAGMAMGAQPRLFDLEQARKHPHFAERGFDERWPEGSFSGVMDFLETREGLVLLEGGPPFSPFGGAHPCAFLPSSAKTHRVEGVALRVPQGVHMMEPSTWDTDLTGSLFTWDEAEELARTAFPSP